MNCRMHFLQFILHIARCIAPLRILQFTGPAPQNAPLICRIARFVFHANLHICMARCMFLCRSVIFCRRSTQKPAAAFSAAADSDLF